MMPDTGTDTPRINIVVDSASPPVISIAECAIVADDTRLHQGADHDEQTREEQQRLPFDAGEVVRPVHPRDQYQSPGTDQRHNGRLDVQHRMSDECGEHHNENDSALDQQSGIANRLTLLERHDVGDPIGIDTERTAEEPRQHRDEHRDDDEHDRRHVQRESR